MDKSETTIKGMFSEIAPSYDRVNSVLSLGIHHLWKKDLVKKSQVTRNQSVLDCATGTGDLALLFKNKVGKNGNVIGTDYCKEMLELAPAKAESRNLDVKFEIADAMNLNYPDNNFDCTSISFGIRNVEDRNKALKEMARVTRPTGKVMILEFGQVYIPGARQAFDFYSNKVLPKIGGWISGKSSAYQYLNDSSQVFPSGKAFADEIMATQAYQQVEFWPVSLGIAYIYRCTPKA